MLCSIGITALLQTRLPAVPQAGSEPGEEMFGFFTPSLLLSSQTLTTKTRLLWIKQSWMTCVLKKKRKKRVSEVYLVRNSITKLLLQHDRSIKCVL